MTSSHDTLEDPRNERVLVWLNGALVPRERAVVSVLDAGFLLGDGIWESFRVLHGKPAFARRRLQFGIGVRPRSRRRRHHRRPDA